MNDLLANSSGMVCCSHLPLSERVDS